jgi:nicotinamidase-related amidase
MDDFTAPEWGRSALLTIDVQRDFTLNDAVLCIPGTMEALPAMQSLTQAYRDAGRPIVHIVRLYHSDGSNADLCRRAMIQGGVSMAVPGSEGSQLMEEILPSPDAILEPERLLQGQAQQIGPNEWIVYKPRFGAFYNTGLESLLRQVDATTLVVIGCNFPNCPRTTIYEATERDFRVVMVLDAVSGTYDRGIEELRNIGVEVLNTAEVLKAIKN